MSDLEVVGAGNAVLVEEAGGVRVAKVTSAIAGVVAVCMVDSDIKFAPEANLLLTRAYIMLQKMKH
jgi:hypothetical protein